MLLIAEIDQRVEVVDRLEHDIAAAAAIAAVRPAELDEFLAPERDQPAPPSPLLQVDFRLVEEFHR